MRTKVLVKLGYTMVFSAFFLAGARTQAQDNDAVKIIEQKRKEQFAEFKSDTSPLTEKQRRKLKQIEYYPIDLAYRVKATLVRTETPQLFKMKTSTSRLPEYRKYGEVHFILNGVEQKLEVYESAVKTKGYEKYLFIPFTDKTNGVETYEAGRYIDILIPETDEVIIDFNLCYNPYCSYNHKYSCPIPPAANDLPLEIKAGEKKFRGPKG